MLRISEMTLSDATVDNSFAVDERLMSCKCRGISFDGGCGSAIWSPDVFTVDAGVISCDVVDDGGDALALLLNVANSVFDFDLRQLGAYCLPSSGTGTLAGEEDERDTKDSAGTDESNDMF